MTDPHGSGFHQAKRSLGQNFLIDPNLQRKIAEAIEPSPDDEVLEIGPGMGALTRHLAGQVGRLVLVELDDDLAARLEGEFEPDPSVTVIRSDILEVEPGSLLRNTERAKVIGNIPYNITTPIIFHFLERRPRPALIVVMIQREVADRILAEPGSRTYGALAVGVQAVADVERVTHVGRNAFRPVPDVDSTVIRIVPRQPPPLAVADEEALRQLTRMGFGQRRKQFQRILRDGCHLSPEQIATLEEETGFDLRQRPETFSPSEFVTLAHALRARGWLAPEGREGVEIR